MRKSTLPSPKLLLFIPSRKVINFDSIKLNRKPEFKMATANEETQLERLHRVTGYEQFMKSANVFFKGVYFLFQDYVLYGKWWSPKKH